MNKSLNLLPSCQPNRLKAQEEYEGTWAKKVADVSAPLLKSMGWEVDVPWSFDANGDLKELLAQINAAKIEGNSFTLSIHINAGSGKPAGILMVTPTEHKEHRKWAEVFGKKLGSLTGMGYDGILDESQCHVKKLAVFRRLPNMPNILIECGNMSNAPQAAWLEENINFVGQCIATATDESVHEVYGTTLGKPLAPQGPTSSTTNKPDTPTLAIFPAMWRKEQPYMRGPAVLVVQKFLVASKIYPDMAQDSVYGPRTREAVTIYQKGVGLVPDGIVGPKTWAKMYGWS